MFKEYNQQAYLRQLPLNKVLMIKSNTLPPTKSGLDYLNRVCSASFGFQSRVGLSRDIFSKMINPPIEIFSSILIFDLLIDMQPSSILKVSLKKFLTSQDVCGVFNFFVNKELIADDVDCTALCVSALLREGCFDKERAKLAAKLIIANVDEKGVIQVYLPPRGDRAGRIDPVVCANVMRLLYQLGLDSEAKKTEDYLYQILESRAYLGGSLYYPSPDAFLYFLSRAVSFAPAVLDRFKHLLAVRIKERIGVTSYALDMAMRILAVDAINLLAVEDKQVLEAISEEKQKLERLQGPDGSWPKEALFKTSRANIFFGSKALTTAFAVKALESLQKNPLISNLILAFPIVLQNPDIIIKLRAEITNWIEHNKLFKNIAKDKRYTIIAASCAYAKNCSPKNSPSNNLKIAIEFLLLLLWFANDYNDSCLHPEFPDILQSIIDILEGKDISNQNSIIPEMLKQLDNFRQNLLNIAIENKISISSFIHSVKQSYAAFLWEWKVSGRPVDVETYKYYRLFSIFIYPWFELWKILNKLNISLDLIINQRLTELEQLAGEIMYMHNDLYSIDQDLKKNKQNLILILKREKKLSIEAAVNEVKKSIDEKIERFLCLSNKLEQQYPASLFEYLNFLKSCVQGNIISMIELKERYSATHLNNADSSHSEAPLSKL